MSYAVETPRADISPRSYLLSRAISLHDSHLIACLRDAIHRESRSSHLRDVFKRGIDSPSR